MYPKYTILQTERSSLKIFWMSFMIRTCKATGTY